MMRTTPHVDTYIQSWNTPWLRRGPARYVSAGPPSPLPITLLSDTIGLDHGVGHFALCMNDHPEVDLRQPQF